MQTKRAIPRSRGGYALLAVLLVVLAVGILALGATSVVGNASLINAYESRRTELEALADGGLELARARLNADRTLFPASGYVALENGVTPSDASGAPIPGVTRYTYAGPIGDTRGQYGVFGSVVTVVQAGNVRVVRRGDVLQESFSRYAYFTDVEPSNIAFGGGDQISGPVHTNDVLKIYSSRATFRGPGGVTTARYIDGKQYGTFTEGYTESAPRIELPGLADLDRLREYAQEGGTSFAAPNGGSQWEARLRIEFVTVGDEGFFRVFRSSGDPHRLMATEPGAGWEATDNCVWAGPPGYGVRSIQDDGGNSTARLNRLKHSTARCYLGGADELQPGGVFRANQGGSWGQWVQRPFPLEGAITPELAARDDRDFLFPLNRGRNPEFRGVIHVTGKVAVSGVLRGRVTLAATDRIFIVDDLTYATGGAEGCDDILGLFGGSDVVVSDNALNTPQRIGSGYSAAWKTLDDTSDEFINGVILTLNTFTVEDFDGGPTSQQPCGTTAFGRGCLFLTGGVIQRTRGAVGTSAGTGYVKRYAYDACAYSNPPPYFPTTGHFGRSRYYEVDPVGFDVGSFYARMTGN